MIDKSVKLGQNVVIPHPELVNLYGCRIGTGTKIASFVEIQEAVTIGRNCKIQPFVFIPSGVTIEDNVFIGPHVSFTNDKYPAAVTKKGKLKRRSDWKIEKTLVRKGANIGAGACILPGLVIGRGAMVGAGSVVTHDVPDKTTVIGNPARPR